MNREKQLRGKKITFNIPEGMETSARDEIKENTAIAGGLETEKLQELGGYSTPPVDKELQ